MQSDIVSENADNFQTDESNILPDIRNQFPLCLNSSDDIKVSSQLYNLAHTEQWNQNTPLSDCWQVSWHFPPMSHYLTHSNKVCIQSSLVEYTQWTTENTSLHKTQDRIYLQEYRGKTTFFWWVTLVIVTDRQSYGAAVEPRSGGAWRQQPIAYSSCHKR